MNLDTSGIELKSSCILLSTRLNEPFLTNPSYNLHFLTFNSFCRLRKRNGILNTLQSNIYYNYFLLLYYQQHIFLYQLLVMRGRRHTSVEECTNVSDMHGGVYLITARPVVKTKQTSIHL